MRMITFLRVSDIGHSVHFRTLFCFLLLFSHIAKISHLHGKTIKTTLTADVANSLKISIYFKSHLNSTHGKGILMEYPYWFVSQS